MTWILIRERVEERVALEGINDVIGCTIVKEISEVLIIIIIQNTQKDPYAVKNKTKPAIILQPEDSNYKKGSNAEPSPLDENIDGAITLDCTNKENN